MAKRKARKTIRKRARGREPRTRVVKKKVVMEKHHRLPRSRGGSSSASNLSVISQPVHRAWHYLFGNANAQEVARMISDVYIDSNYYFVCVPRHRPTRKCRRTRCMCTTCGAEVMKVLPKTNK